MLQKQKDLKTEEETNGQQASLLTDDTGRKGERWADALYTHTTIHATPHLHTSFPKGGGVAGKIQGSLSNLVSFTRKLKDARIILVRGKKGSP